MNRHTANRKILKDLGNGLILRRSTPADAEALAEFHTTHLSPNSEGLRYWIRDLMTRPHPTFHRDDFTIVEDTGTGKIVSSMALISQTWSYGGIKIRVGRPEIVSTHPDYRRRGLVRAQFEIIHEWSAQRGEQMTAITGIPYFYRQFGYEMAVARGGGRTGHLFDIPSLGKGQKEPYRVRRARESDLSFITTTYRNGSRRLLLTDVRTKSVWEYELKGRHKKSSNWHQVCIIEDAKGKRVGFLVHRGRLHGHTMWAGLYELKPGASWLSVTPSVLRYLEKAGRRYAMRQGQEFREFTLALGTEHPVYQVFPGRLPNVRHPYAWYLRVPDVPGFLRHVSPVLEERLRSSVMARHTGEAKLSFYRTGTRLMFRRGKLRKVESWQPSPGDRSQAGFPGLTFLQVLFGYRTLDDLGNAFPDCWARGDGTRALLNALFPKQASDIWPVA